MRDNMYDLTNPQKSIWFTEEFYKGTPMENIAGSVIINEKVDFKLLTTAINLFIKNNDSFNIRFTQTKEGVKQYLNDFKPLPIEIIDVSTDKNVEEIEKQLSITPFNVIDSELYSTKLFKFADNHGGFSICIHHLIGDAWTSGLIIDGIINIYSELLKDSKKSDFEFFSYLEYINSENEYLKSEKFNKDKSFWNELYKEVPELASIPTMNSVSKTSCDAKRKVFTLPKETFELVNSFAKKYKASPFNFFMAVFAIYLGRVSNLDEFVIGTPVLNRSNFKDKHTTGMFISTVPFKVTINNETTFSEFVSKISSDFFDIFRHQKYPYQYLLEDLRKDNPSIPNLYDMALSYQNMRTNSNSSDINFSSSWATPDYIADSLDIHFFDLDNTGKINIAYDYQTAKYSIDDICSIHARILNMINQILKSENLLLKDIEIVTPDEKQKLLYDFNNTAMDYPKDKTISQLFEEQVEKTPDNIAVVFEDQKLTYKELNEKANSLANYLIEQEISSGDCVPVLLNRSIDLIISMLAIIKIGAIYLPLSADYPMDRLNYILSDSRAKKVITNSKINLILEYNISIINFDKLHLENYNNQNLNKSISPLDILYIIYTSGSTGNPKGVGVMHKNLNNFIHSFNNNFETISSNDKLLASTNICFDVSIFEFYITLLNGASLYLYEENTINNIFKYCDSIINNNITMLYIAPNILEEVYQILEKNNYKNINKLLLGVEPIKSKVIKKYYNLNSNMKIINAYGPTEATICATYYILTKENIDNYKIIPIGKPLHNLNLFILDKNHNVVPTGVSGELYICGDNVTKGYIFNKDLTKKSFVKIPYSNLLAYKTGDIVKWDTNGNIIFVGRNDSQIKINGHRIELGEIEGVIYSYPNINKCIVTVNKDNKLIAYFSAYSSINITDLKTFLQTKLPLYFIPNFLVQVDKFKLTNNGKIDKKALQKIKLTTTSNYEEPHNEEQKKLVSIFKSILNVSDVGINDNFFELGGDSLVAIKLQIEAFNSGINISYKDIFDYPTIKHLSEKISTKSVNPQIDNYDYSSINKMLDTMNIGKIKKEKFKNILLTGSTGFLGAHILDSLLKTTKCNIYCLIRAKKNTDPQTRLVDILHFYFGNKYDKYIFKRIFVVEGDISKKNLGIQNIYYDELGNDIDCVINSAALVKHYGLSNLFNETNIAGTQNIIDFCLNFNCKLIHISTLSVCGNMPNTNSSTEFSNKKTFTERNLFINQDLSNIYIYTKFLAERLILENISNKNLDAKIIRLGNITNRYSDGMFQINVSENAFLSKIHSFLKIGSVPDYLASQYVEFTPVDICSDAIVKLMLVQTPLKVFHLFNNHTITFKDLLKMFDKFNLKINLISSNLFNLEIKKISKSDDKKSDLSGIINDFNDNGFLEYETNTIIQNSLTTDILKKLYFKWPKIDAKYIKKYVVYLKSIGYI